MGNLFSADHFSDTMPSVATLERYLSGGMAEDELVRFEAQMAEDPFLADAVDGMRMSMTDKDLSGKLAQLRERVALSVEALPESKSSNSRRKSRIKPFPQYLLFTAIAAGFALLLVFVGLLNKHQTDPLSPEGVATQSAPSATDDFEDQDNLLAESATQDLSNSESEEEEEDLEIIEDDLEEELLAIANSPEPGRSRLGLDEEESMIDHAEDDMLDEIMQEDFPAGGAVSPPGSVVMPAAPVAAAPRPAQSAPAAYSAPSDAKAKPDHSSYGNTAMDPARSQAATSPSQLSEEELRALQENAVVETTAMKRDARQQPMVDDLPPPTADFSLEDVPTQPLKDITYGQLSKASLITDLLTKAISLQESGKPDSALLYLNEVLDSEPANVTAAFYKGKSLLDKREASAAIPWLELASGNLQSPLYQEARWLLAEAYLADGKKRKCMALLESIAADNGPFREDAQALLDSLK